ncbi:hypothetical protein AWC38_SpisGene22432 [Stylophora pistillata]|uniref:Integrase catalytic domain-containing protein n=1 Tax=Stylophora pistillata TaxID=50429 RepID=A0A2B4RAT6_STYPI|nr:hypothetical protein AWC38_SpisGene22432 [Stylophora pistillata]
MSKDLEAIKKKRRFLRKSVTDTLKSIDEALSEQDSHGRVQVLKDNIASKWSDLQEVQGTMCIMLEDADIDAECEIHNEYEARIIESMAKMTSYFASKHVSEVKLAGNSPPASQSSSQVQVQLPKINLPAFGTCPKASKVSERQRLKACVSDALKLVIELKCARSLHASTAKEDISVLHQDSARPHLCEVKVKSAPELPSSSSGPPVPSSVVANSVAVGSVGKVILQTVPAIFCGLNGCSKVVRCFFDLSSQTSEMVYLRNIALKDNYQQAESRLYNLEKKLLQEPMKAMSYIEAINKYVDNGVAEEVLCDEITPTDGRPVFYLPHHAVIRKDKQTTKRRVVFDASAKDSCGPQNRADLPTRGLSASQLGESHLWWKGPFWLQESEKDWHEDLRSKPSDEIVDQERKSKASVSCIVEPKEPFIDFTRFSKYSRLLRTVAWIKRFVTNSRVKEDERIDSILTSSEIQNAERWLISHVQKASFPEEITSSKQHGPEKDGNLANLNPFMYTTSGFLRVRGRIHKSLLPEEEKHPIILPSNHPVVKLLIDDVHRRELHAGVEHTFSVLRQKFRLIKGRLTVRQTLRNCLLCRHYLTKPFGQRMAPLPEDRIKPAPPFTNVGLDFAGLLYLKDSGDKVYICLFTCAVTRAVHLELVCDMTAERFLLALRRMIARRGMCSIIWSDNAKNFKAAHKELRQCWRVLQSDQTQSVLSQKKIQWKFIVEKAPWWGGFYERVIKSVKTPLKKLFAKAMLDTEQLTTILAEIKAQLNSRPLTYLGADPDGYSVITPAHILIGRNLQVCPTKDTRVSEQTSRALTKRF